MDLDLPLPVGTEIELTIPPEISFYAADETTVILQSAIGYESERPNPLIRSINFPD